MRNAKMKEENQRLKRGTEHDTATMASMISPPRKSDEKKVAPVQEP
jgi:hypothetical protein